MLTGRLGTEGGTALKRPALPLVHQPVLDLLDALQGSDSAPVLSPELALGRLRRLVDFGTLIGSEGLVRQACVARAFPAVQTFDAELIEATVRSDAVSASGGAVDPQIAIQAALGAQLLGRPDEAFELLLRAARTAHDHVAEAEIATEIAGLFFRSHNAASWAYRDTPSAVSADPLADRRISGMGELPLRLRLELRASESYAQALRALASKDYEAAAACCSTALQALDVLGYGLCAAQVEMDVVAALSLPTPNLHEASRKMPNSWFSAKGDDTGLLSNAHRQSFYDFRSLRSNLGTAERKVLDLICAGLTTREMPLKSTEARRRSKIRLYGSSRPLESRTVRISARCRGKPLTISRR